MSRAALLAIAEACDRFLKAVQPDWQDLHDIADEEMPAVKRAFLQAVARLQGSITEQKVADALAQGDAQAAEDAIDWPLFEAELLSLNTVLRPVVARAGKAAAAHLLEKFGIEYGFDIRNPLAEAWLKQNAAERIVQVSDDTKAGVRAIIQDAFENGGHPFETAKSIKQLVGLTDRQAMAVRNQAGRMQAAGADEETIARESEAYAGRLQLYRAETIARTETISAACSGQQLAWQDAADQGLLDPERMYKKWIVTPDDKLCPECEDMGDQDPVPIDASFGEVMNPPLHPNCRCSAGLIEVKGAGDSGAQESDADESGAEEEEVGKAQRILKYPGQPRDDRGRFGEGGQDGNDNRKHDIHVKDAIPLTGGENHIKADSTIKGVVVMAGGNKIRDVERLVEKYRLTNGEKSPVNDWQKARGTAIIINDDTDEESTEEVHWYQAKNVGKVEIKLKPQRGDPDGNDG